MAKKSKKRVTVLQRGRNLFMKLQRVTLEGENAHKAEVDARQYVQSTGTAIVEARRDWDRWLAEASVQSVTAVMQATLNKLEGK